MLSHQAFLPEASFNAALHECSYTSSLLLGYAFQIQSWPKTLLAPNGGFIRHDIELLLGKSRSSRAVDGVLSE